MSLLAGEFLLSARSVAFVLVSSMLLAGTPLSAAIVEEHADARHLTLFVQSGEFGTTDAHGLSPFAGDAMPSDSSTHVTNGRLRATTPPIADDIVLEPAGAFRIILPLVVQSGRYVNATIDVEAVDLLGRSHPLASARFVPPPFDPQGDVYAAAALVNAPAVNESAGAVEQSLRDQVEDLTQGNLLWNALNTTYDHGATCRPSATTGQQQPACNQLTGHYGYGQIRFGCKSPRSNVGALAWDAFKTAANTIDGTRLTDQLPGPLRGASACDGAFDHANQTAAEVGPTPGPLPPTPATPTLPGGNASETYVPPQWQNVTLNATSAFLTRPDGRIVIPSGYRLEFEVTASSAASTRGPYVPTEFEIGRADALARMVLLTYTPGVFASLATSAEWIGPGIHTGTFANLTDVDHYAIAVGPGERFEIAPLNGAYVALWDPLGQVRSGPTWSHAVAEGIVGKWTIAVSRTTAVPTSEYAFEVRDLAAVGNDDGWMVEGENVGDLGPGDDQDSWYGFAWKGQDFSVRVDGGALVLDVDIEPSLFLTAVPNEDGSTTYHAVASSTGLVNVTVARAGGSGNYTLTFWRDAADELDLKPVLSPIASFTQGDVVGAMAGHALGVDLSIRRDLSHRVQRFFDDGSENVTMIENTTGGSLAHTADLAIVHTYDAPAPMIGGIGRTLEETELVRRTGNTFAFGPDGALYIVKGNSLVVLDASRSERTLPLGGTGGDWDDLWFAPNGVAGLRSTFGARLAVNVTTGEILNASLLSEDHDAQGRRYEAFLEDLVVRIDPATGAVETLAWTDLGKIVDLAFSATKLYALIDVPVIPEHTLAVVDLGVEGFTGFHPEFDMAPLPNLVPASFEPERLGVLVNGTVIEEEWVLNFSVRNDGEGMARTTRIDLRHDCRSIELSPCFSWAGMTPVLQPGETATFSAFWRTGRHLGDQEFALHVDIPGETTQSNVEDDRAEYIAWAFVHGNDQVCRGMLTLVKSAATLLEPPFWPEFDTPTVCATTHL